MVLHAGALAAGEQCPGRRAEEPDGSGAAGGGDVADVDHRLDPGQRLVEPVAGQEVDSDRTGYDHTSVAT
jgi:hypothetical protein